MYSGRKIDLVCVLSGLLLPDNARGDQLGGIAGRDLDGTVKADIGSVEFRNYAYHDL